MTLRIRSIKYHIKEGLKSITKNGLMSIASIASVSACALMLIISLCIAINLDRALEKVEESIGVSLYLGEDINDEEIKNLLNKLQAIPNILDIKYMSKEDALNWAKEEWDNNNEILAGLEDDNPFPRSFEISISAAKYQKQVINEINNIQVEFEKELLASRNKEQEQIQEIIENPLDKPMDISKPKEEKETETTTEDIPKIGDKDYKFIGIEKIRHSQKESNILLAVNNAIRIGSIIIILVLAIISVAIIINTIKIAVYVRKTEINIMKYVGATDWFIRWPFIIEGIVIGTVGALIAIFIGSFGYSQSISVLYEKIPMIKNYVELKDTFSMFLVITPVTIILGALLGVIGSVSSIKKHLQV